MGLVSIGPVAVSHGNPSFDADAVPTDHGIDSVTIAGSCSWAAAKSLRALVRNQANRTTKGGHTGILEWLVFDDDLLDDWTGYYIVEGFRLSAQQKDSLTTEDVPFTLSAAYLGDVA